MISMRSVKKMEEKIWEIQSNAQSQKNKMKAIEDKNNILAKTSLFQLHYH